MHNILWCQGDLLNKPRQMKEAQAKNDNNPLPQIYGSLYNKSAKNTSKEDK